MKNIYMLAAVFTFLCGSVTAQVYPFIESFNNMTSFTNPAGWTCTVPGFQIYPNHGRSGTKGMTKNMTSLGSQSDSVISPVVGPIQANTILSFDYRVMESSLYPCCAHALTTGDAIELSAVSGPISLPILTIDQSTHLTDTAWKTIQINIGQLSGQIGSLKIKLTRGAGDYFVDFDNFSVGGPTSLNDAAIAQAPLLYPNPSGTGFKLLLKGIENDVYKVSVVAESGSQVQLTNLAVSGGETMVDTGNLANGIYLLQLTGNNKNYGFRFVVKD